MKTPNAPLEGLSISSRLRRYTCALAIVWTLILGASLAYNIREVHNDTRNIVHSKAVAHFNKDQALRFWGTRHGGVYVPVDQHTAPNPYLANISERDIETPSGKRLTLMNPAFIVRQINEWFSDLYGVFGHITSLKPLRPANAPDDWERAALVAFERGGKEVSMFSSMDGKPYFRFMRPMLVKKGCLKCHGHQGYKEGDIRGGVSVSVPLTPVLADQDKRIKMIGLTYASLWMIGLLGIGVGWRQIRKSDDARNQAIIALRHAHDELESRVKERTAELAVTNEELEREVAERRLLLNKLRGSEAKSRALLNAPPESALLIDAEGCIIALNETAHKRLGEHTDNFVGENIYDIATPDIAQDTKARVEEVIRSGKAVRFENEVQDRWFDQTIYPVFRGSGEVRQLAIFSYDITARRKAEAELEKANVELEKRVEERTVELVRTNEKLRREAEERKQTQRALSDSRQQYEELWNHAPAAYHTLDTGGIIVRVNKTEAEMLGYEKEEMVGKPIFDFILPEQQEEAKERFKRKLAGEQVPKHDNRIYITKQGSEVYVSIDDKLERSSDGKIVGVRTTMVDITERKRAEDATRISEEELRHLSSQLLNVQENERKRIAGELHDSIGQSLTAIKFGLENILHRRSKGTAETSPDMIEALIPIVQQASEEVRQIYTNLRPSMLDDLGILSTISWFCREFEKVYSGIIIETQSGVEEEEVPENLKIVVFRVLQEAMNNIAKHGKASLVRISLIRADGELELVVEDNGEGFDVEHVRSEMSTQGGFGLTSMKERTEFSGGTFSIKATPGTGTTVRASWPA